MDLSNLDLLSLQTNYMKQDPTTIALCQALNLQFQQLSVETKLCLIYSRIDELAEPVLDELAWQFHVDWYDATADISVKRNLIKSSIFVHSHLGTPAAVEQVVQDYFGDGMVDEWFNYSGVPGHFRIQTANSAVTGDVAQKLIVAIEKVKRKSAWLDEIIIFTDGTLNVFYGFALHIGDFITVRQEA